MNYLQHRISHMWDVSKQLFEKGYLTIGWQGLMQSGILEAAQECGESGFADCAVAHGLVSRNRWCLYRFFSMQPGDIVIIPLYEQDFAIAKVSSAAKTISELPVSAFSSVCGRRVKLDSCLSYEDDGTIIDIGFFLSIDLTTVKIVPRAYASAKLQSRMKHQYINVDVNDLAEEIIAASEAEAPLDLRDVILAAAASPVLEAIHKLTPDGLELLVKWYMEQSGATRVYRPAKNESGKENGADADVIAEFASLGIVFFIQVKKHEGYTSDWAIKQISFYKEQKENIADDFTYIPWVITTAAFKEDVKELAHNVGVRLIDGITFAKMIVDTGVESINAVIEQPK